MLKRLRVAGDEKNKVKVKSINKTLTKIKNIVKNVPKDKVTMVEENEKTPNQMLSRLPITLAQFKAENNSEKLKNKMR